MKPIEFAIVGAGWRAEFFLRIARTLPDRFRIAGMAVRNGERGKAVEAAWGVSTFCDIDGLLAATAIHHNLTLVTRNTKDMARTGVTLFNPWSE